MRILMVEDDHVLGGLICEALQVSATKRSGVPTTEARSARSSGVASMFCCSISISAPRAARGSSSACAILARRCRRSSSSRVRPLDVIATAARTTDAATFLRKPYTIDELLTAIEEAMA